MMHFFDPNLVIYHPIGVSTRTHDNLSNPGLFVPWNDST
jgi:hypothetical protein